MSVAAAPQRCIVCGLAPRRAFRLRNGADLLRCPRCRLGWWEWPEFEPAAFYDRDYFQSPATARGYSDYAALEDGLRRTARGRLRRIARLADRGARGGGRLLDVGCGTGVFLEQARRADWEVCGVEVSEYAAGQARARGLTVTCASVEAAHWETGTFGCVTLWDVLEHLPDPPGVLRRAAAALVPGGVLALSTGDVTSLCARLSGPHWHLFNLPEHLFFFSPRSLRALLERAGCRVVRVVREVNWVPLAYVLERLSKSLGRGRPMAGTRRRPWLLPATLLDVLGVYAVRRADVPDRGAAARPRCSPPRR